MLTEKVELKTIASIIGKSVKTKENWHLQYVTKGVDSLNAFQYSCAGVVSYQDLVKPNRVGKPEAGPFKAIN